jgi:hypothetical protein
MTNSPTIEYFGMETVEKAIADFFSKHGVTEDVRDYLMALEIEDADAFFQMVENYVERK